MAVSAAVRGACHGLDWGRWGHLLLAPSPSRSDGDAGAVRHAHTRSKQHSTSVCATHLDGSGPTSDHAAPKCNHYSSINHAWRPRRWREWGLCAPPIIATATRRGRPITIIHVRITGVEGRGRRRGRGRAGVPLGALRRGGRGGALSRMGFLIDMVDRSTLLGSSSFKTPSTRNTISIDTPAPPQTRQPTPPSPTTTPTTPPNSRTTRTTPRPCPPSPPPAPATPRQRSQPAPRRPRGRVGMA